MRYLSCPRGRASACRLSAFVGEQSHLARVRPVLPRRARKVGEVSLLVGWPRKGDALTTLEPSGGVAHRVHLPAIDGAVLTLRGKELPRRAQRIRVGRRL